MMDVGRDTKQCIFPFLVLIVSWLLAVPLYKITDYEIIFFPAKLCEKILGIINFHTS